MKLQEARDSVREKIGDFMPSGHDPVKPWAPRVSDAEIDKALRAAGLSAYKPSKDAKADARVAANPQKRYVAWTPGASIADLILLPDHNIDAVIDAAAKALGKKPSEKKE